MTDTDETIDSNPEPPRSARRRHSLRRNLEWVVIVAVAIIAALLVKTFLVEAFYIPSASMEPTLKTGDRVLVNKLSYHLHDVHRGDIIVFKRPPGIAGEPNIKDFIKRVIALPGETIETKDDLVYINGKKLKEPYLPAGTRTVPGIERQSVPAGQYWVMGDNRGNSSDSRVFHTIAESSIIGRAFVEVWPPSRLRLL
jgi:signal peptidase I